MREINWNAVEEAKEFKKPVAGGYICGITAVQDVADKEYLKIEYDFAEGEFKNYWRELYNSKGFWGGSFIRSYKEKALPFFKGFLTAVQESNAGYVFHNDESTLKRKLIGIVLGEEEYLAKDGTVKTRLYVDSVHSVKAIKNKEFEVPYFKKLAPAGFPQAPQTEFTGLSIEDDDGDLPF